MTIEANYLRPGNERRVVIDTAPTAQCEVWQLPDGRAGFLAALNNQSNNAAFGPGGPADRGHRRAAEDDVDGVP
jgi:hypothetical protein